MFGAYYPDPEYRFLSISIIDGFYAIIFLIFVFFLFSFFAKKAAPDEESLKYFMPGLYVKLISVILFCLIYIFHYGGDTLSYFHNMQVLRNLFFDTPRNYFDILFNGINWNKYFYFSPYTGFPTYMWVDPNSFIVSRLFSPITLVFGNSFLINSLVVSTLSYLGNWQLFKMFYSKYPQLAKEMAIACLFIPSVVFWGSGIMKDTIIVFSLSMILVSVNNIIQFKFNVKNFIALILSVWLTIAIKPYVFIALLPGVIIWVGYYPIKKIKSKLLKYVLIPFVSVLVIGVGFLMFSQFSGSLGKYGDYDSMVTKAKVTQEDLIRVESYGANFFYIGEITGTPQNLLQLFPKAVMAGLFRPYIWEVRNVFMLMSGVENLLILLLVLSVFFRRSIGKVFKTIGSDPFLFGLFVFIIFLAFGVGLSTANFGALVRYRIPLMPVFVAAMFIARHYVKTQVEQPREKKKKDFSISLE